MNNDNIQEEFAMGITGLFADDHHWLQQPVATVLGYDLEQKAQWLASLALARVRYSNRAEFEDASVRQQRLALAQWLQRPNEASVDS